jgi:LacI family transcriptional regulator, repressor for deo operon, udp, cdd, tsx, nupC, and nupG
MATLRDVAERAGVSLATASRVASGAATVRPGMRARVERAMHELLYVAPGQPTQTGVIGLLVPELVNPIFPALTQAMETRATATGLACILCNTNAPLSESLSEMEYVHALVDLNVDGMIFISCEMANREGRHDHYGQALSQGKKIVFVNGFLDDFEIPSVRVDERAAGQIATGHLLRLGHRHIGFAAGPERFMPTVEKAAGMRAALVGAGIHEMPPIVHEEFTVEGGRSAARRLMSNGAERPSAVICANDLMAIGVLIEAGAMGLRVPDDLSVVGFDGIEASEWTQPPLTTVEQPIDDIAETSLAALRSLIDDGDRALPDYVFKPQLKVRHSTGPPNQT